MARNWSRHSTIWVSGISAQIAKWTKTDIAIVDDELSFKGRIERDDWVKQAKAWQKAAKLNTSRYSARSRGNKIMLQDKDRIFTNIYGQL